MIIVFQQYTVLAFPFSKTIHVNSGQLRNVVFLHELPQIKAIIYLLAQTKTNLSNRTISSDMIFQLRFSVGILRALPDPKEKES